MSQELIDSIIDMREQDAIEIANRMLLSGTRPLEVLADCRQAMDIIGKRFETGDCFIPELIMAGEILAPITTSVKLRMSQNGETVKKLGQIVFGTVQGDIHNIAKDIVVFMLDVNGFEVIDLGVDVPPSKFIEAVKRTGAKIVGLSGFLTLAYDPMKDTVTALKAAGLTDVKVMIGGGQVDERVRQYTGADAYGRDAVAALELARNWVKVN
jgi:methanogenic corrinoid protein MtbC1